MSDTDKTLRAYLEREFEDHLKDLTFEWEKVGIDPDDMLKCSEHHELMFDPDNQFRTTKHYYKRCEYPAWYLFLEPTHGESDLACVSNSDTMPATERLELSSGPDDELVGSVEDLIDNLRQQGITHIDTDVLMLRAFWDGKYFGGH
jgi:hypothetical protein